MRLFVQARIDLDMCRRLGRGVSIVVTALLILFALIYVVERVVTPRTATPISSLIDAADPEQTVLPLVGKYYAVSGGRQDRLSFRQDIDFTEYTSPALLVIQARYKVSATIGAEELDGDIGRADVSLYKQLDPHFFVVPPGTFGPQDLRLVVRGGVRSPKMAAVLVGEYEPLAKAFRYRRFVGVDIIIGATGIAAVASLIGLVVLPVTRERLLFISFAGMMAAWAFRNLIFLGPAGEWPVTVYWLWYYTCTFGLFLFSLIFVNSWTSQLSWVPRIAVPVLASILVGLLLLVAIDHDRYGLAVRVVGNAIGLIGFAFIMGQIIWALSQKTDPPLIEGGLMAFALWGGMLDVANDAIPGLGIWVFGPLGTTLAYGPQMAIFVTFAMLIRVMRTNLQVQRTLSSANQTLTLRLEAKERELRELYDAREQQNREATLHQERRRIMQDVHDGFGGQLLALQLKARRVGGADSALEGLLKDSLLDLRLLVDSLDTANADLAVAFGALRGRIEPQLRDAGLSLEWRSKLDVGSVVIGPRSTLSIYRAIQEAVSNVIHHAQASSVRVEALVDHGTLHITVRDDGVGPSNENPSGKGIRSIAARAENLGGTATFRTTDAGFEVDLEVPVTNESGGAIIR